MDNHFYEKIKYRAVDGATLTMLGKITYDVSKDEFTMTDALGFVGGGFEECCTFLKSRYEYLDTMSKICLGCSFLCFMIVGVNMLNRKRKKIL
jgi:hypothetical protein